MGLLDVENLKISFHTRRADTCAVKGISFSVAENESVAVVGESGSGKSVTAMSLARLLPPRPACEVSGRVLFDGADVYNMNPRSLRALRGRGIAYIFQEPSTSLNPVFTVGSQIAEAIKLHFPEERNVHARTVEALREVGIVHPELRVKAYPHELSGGMQQRVMIAMALACSPRLLVADEPTTALDVTIQKQIIDLLKGVLRRRKTALILITHNFGIISGLCERVIVMFRGNIVEEGDTDSVLRNPQHPYTRALINCMPRLGSTKKLEPINYDELFK